MMLLLRVIGQIATTTVSRQDHRLLAKPVNPGVSASAAQ